jgi:hypothetical protein
LSGGSRRQVRKTVSEGGPEELRRGEPAGKQRADSFARELGGDWLEVEPGIYVHRSQAPRRDQPTSFERNLESSSEVVQELAEGLSAFDHETDRETGSPTRSEANPSRRRVR